MEGLFRNSLDPAAWILLGIIPPAVLALYFLKLKRQPLEVPSTYLWHRVVEDLHVNSLWQRLRKSVLLFLQLLVLALAMLAVLRPGWQGERLQGQKFIFLLDNSASMSAQDGENGRSRLDEAKQKTAAFIEQLDSDMTAMIVSFAQQPEVVQEFTDNRRQLRASLDHVEATAAQTDLSGALKFVGGFANSSRAPVEDENAGQEMAGQEDIELIILSDGRFASVKDFSLGSLQPKFFPLGTPTAENLAITALNTRQGEERPELVQAFVQISNFSNVDCSVVVELYLNDQLLDAAKVDVPATGIASTTFTLSNEAEGQVVAMINPGSEISDALELDNKAYAVLENRRNARVLLVTPGNPSLEAALTTARARRLANVEIISPTALAGKDYLRKSQTEYFDLMIFDQCAPEKMPQANTLFLGRLPPDAMWNRGTKAQTIMGPQILDWERSHPLLSLLELGGIQIADAFVVEPPVGGRELVSSTEGPIVALAPRNHFEDVVIGFEIVTNNDGKLSFNTDWPRKHSFPGFWLNVLEYFAQGREKSELENRPEKMVELRLSPTEERVEVIRPDGLPQTVILDNSGRLNFQDTGQLGFYEVHVAGRLIKRFAINLFDRDESDIALRVRQVGEDNLQEIESLAIGFVDIAAELPHSAVRRELWKPLLVLALVILLLEWYIYNRRVYV